MRSLVPIIFIVGCSTTDVTTSAQVAGQYQNMILIQNNPATAMIGVYTPAIINAINPPPKIDESVNYVKMRQCGNNTCRKNHWVHKKHLTHLSK